MFRQLAAALLFRRLSRDVADIAASLRQQNALLTRLADHWAPVDPRTARVEVYSDTGVSHVDADEVVEAEAYSARTYRDTGHVPDDEEVLIHLADERTVDLHQRLTDRGAELDRLRETREW